MSAPRMAEFVTFVSPGTFFAETTTLPIASRDLSLAVKMSRKITERYGSRPYGFRFETRIVADPIPDGCGGSLAVEPKTVDTSSMHFLGGKVETFADVERRADPKESILCGNMSGNGMWIVVTTTSPYRSTCEFKPADVVVNDRGEIVKRGDSAERVAYRAACDLARGMP